MTKALEPVPFDTWLEDQQRLIDRGEDPLEQLLVDQAEADAHEDRQADYGPNPIRSTA